MTLSFNAAFQSELQPQRSAAKAGPSAEDGLAFMAAMEQMINQEHKRSVTVGSTSQQNGAAMQKHKFMIEDGKNLKFPMDEDIMQELLDTVKAKIKQLKQLREELDLN